MRTSSAKAKGRRCAKEAIELMHKYAPSLKEGDMVATPSGVTGPDIQLSPAAKLEYPFAIECKNQESIQIWKAYEQAKSHEKLEELPLLIFKRNKSKIMVALEFEHLLMMLK